MARRFYAKAPRRVPGTMNKLEARYADEVLTPLLHTGRIRAFWFERLTFKLAADTRYTPDFVVIGEDDTLECHEVKGFFRDDAKVKIKVAADLFPFHFRLVRWQEKQWQVDDVA